MYRRKSPGRRLAGKTNTSLSALWKCVESSSLLATSVGLIASNTTRLNNVRVCLVPKRVPTRLGEKLPHRTGNRPCDFAVDWFTVERPNALINNSCPMFRSVSFLASVYLRFLSGLMFLYSSVFLPLSLLSPTLPPPPPPFVCPFFSPLSSFSSLLSSLVSSSVKAPLFDAYTTDKTLETSVTSFVCLKRVSKNSILNTALRPPPYQDLRTSFRSRPRLRDGKFHVNVAEVLELKACAKKTKMGRRRKRSMRSRERHEKRGTGLTTRWSVVACVHQRNENKKQNPVKNKSGDFNYSVRLSSGRNIFLSCGCHSQM